jgi:rare lipoprotein A
LNAGAGGGEGARRRLQWALALALLVSCVRVPSSSLDGFVEVGEASFYGAHLGGRKTASGAKLDLGAFTCAHRTLPFGTKVRVTDLDTGRSTDVVVNDRGPFVRGRIVDLTPAAAQELGYLKRGLARVRIERLR